MISRNSPFLFYYYYKNNYISKAYWKNNNNNNNNGINEDKAISFNTKKAWDTIKWNEMEKLRKKMAYLAEEQEQTVSLTIMVWNAQSLNKKVDKREGKIKFIKEITMENKPDIIYIGDTNTEEIIIEGYKKVYDGRNILLVKANITIEWKVKDNMIWNDEFKLGFVYMVPNSNAKEIRSAVQDWIKMDYDIIGDLNLKFNKVNWGSEFQFKGEESLCVGIISKKQIKCDKFGAPSDHKLVMIQGIWRIKGREFYTFTSLEDAAQTQIVKDIIEGNKAIIEPRVIKKEGKLTLNEREEGINKLLDDIMQADTKEAYKRYEWKWKIGKKEPFLGKQIPERVADTYAKHLRAKDNKIYPELEMEDILRMTNIPIRGAKRTYSRALTYEGMKLNKISQSVNDILEDYKFGREELIKNMIMNLLLTINQNRTRLRAEAFFLRKNKELRDFGDVRVIMVMPALVKMYEGLYYERIASYISLLIGNKGYQRGGIIGGSTYAAIDRARKIFSRTKGPILSMDLDKGFDRINLRMLQQCIEDDIKDEDTKAILKIWTVIVMNLDLAINVSQIIKRTRGIPMGLSFSPLIFVLYVDWALKDIDKRKMVMYIDDLLYFPSPETMEEETDILKNKLEEKELIINSRKSAIWIREKVEIKGWLKEIKQVDAIKYLGMQIKIVMGNMMADERYIKVHKNRSATYWINFAIKRLIWNGALEAKQRYKGMMWAYEEKVVRKKIIQDQWLMFKGNLGKYSYVQMWFSLNNNMRLFIDRVKLKEWIRISKENKERKVAEEVRQYLLVGHEQWDKVIQDMNIDLEYLGKVKSKVRTIILWNEFKVKALERYIQEKKEMGEKVDKEFIDWVKDEKLYNMAGVIQMLMWKHVIWQETKAKKLWVIMQILVGIREWVYNTMERIEEEQNINIQQFWEQDFEIQMKPIQKERWLEEQYQQTRRTMQVIQWVKNKAKQKFREARKKAPGRRIYTDATYQEKGRWLGLGLVMVEDDVILEEKSIAIKSQDYTLRQIEGELKAAVLAAQWAIQRGWKEWNLCFDFIGVYFYTTNLWKRDNVIMEKYFEDMRKLRGESQIGFIHITSHTGDWYNDRADKLAEIALIQTGKRTRPSERKEAIKEKMEQNMNKMQKEKVKELWIWIKKIIIMLDTVWYDKTLDKLNEEELWINMKIKTHMERSIIDKILYAMKFEEAKEKHERTLEGYKIERERWRQTQDTMQDMMEEAEETKMIESTEEERLLGNIAMELDK